MKSLITALVLTISLPLAGQTDTNSKFYMEGSLRLAFGDQTRLGISPAVHYSLSPTISIGSGVIVESYTSTVNDTRSSTWIYGLNILANYNIKRLTGILNERTSLFLHFEQEFLNIENHHFNTDTGRSWTDASFLGFKIKRKIGTKDRFALSLIAIWNMNQNEITDLLYNNPIIKLGFQF